MALLDVTNLSVDFQTDQGVVHAVRNISFQVGESEVVGIVGESGSGKSVTSMSILHLLADTARIKEGSSIRFDGEELIGAGKKRMREIRGEKISMIFRIPCLP